jgi:hypothetical protein
VFGERVANVITSIPFVILGSGIFRWAW